MQLKFTVNKQHIVRTDFAHVVAGSRNYLECAFRFSEEWNGFVKTAVFEKDGVVYHVVLQEDAIPASSMPVFSAGVWRISVFGGNLITADSAALMVFASGYTEENAPTPPSATVYETLTALIAANAAKTEELEEKIGTGSAGGGAAAAISGETLYIGKNGTGGDA